MKSEIIDKYKQLPIIIDSLNDKGLEIINTNTSIAQNKKLLMQLTKEKSKNLIKEYQAEIDLLVNRLRQTQSWFLDLYKLVKSLPDPVPLIAEFTKEIDSLVTERSRLHDELAKASTHTEDNKKLLILSDEYNANVEMLKEQEYALQRQVNLLTDQLKSQSSQHEIDKKVTARELLELEQKLQAKIAQADLLGSDLKMSALQIEKNQVVIKQLSEQLVNAKQVGLDSLQQEHLNELSMLNTQLLNQKSHFESLLNQANQQALDQLELSKDAFLRQIAQLKEENESLNASLKDYNTCKMELEIFKANLDIDSDNVPLETLLINKNKQLENEYTEIKQKHSVLEAEMQQHLTKYADLHKVTVSQTGLIKQLENDIRSLEQKPAVFAIYLECY
jgi:homeobox protein cut-like